MHRLFSLIVTTVCCGMPPAHAQVTDNHASAPAAQGATHESSAPNAGEPQTRRRGDGDWPFPRVHDPSTIVRDGERYWLFHTGQGVGSLYSDDLVRWERGPAIFECPPEWVNDVVPGHRGYFWAPDVVKLGERYLVYYSVSAFGKQTSAIALASSPTLDTTDQRYQWTDHGIVVQTDDASDHNAIDPSICLTSRGELWMSYGSFWSGIKLVQLDPETGLRLAADSPLYSLAYKEQIEAPGLYEHDGYFYLFLNWGWCCRGINSTYNIRVGRSRSVTGPYVDRDGKDLKQGGGTLVLESAGEQIGPGHAGLTQVDGGWRLSYHYYDAKAWGRPRLGIRRLRWTDDGWPEVVAEADQE